MRTLKQILAELTAFGYLANFGRRTLQLLSAALPAPQRLPSSRFRMNKQVLRDLMTLASILLTGLCVPPTSAAQQLSSVPDPQRGTICGTVEDVNGGIIPGAKIALNPDTPDNHQETVAGDNGFFQFANVQPGVTYHVTASAPDFADWTSAPVTLTPGQYFLLTGIQLRLSTVQVSIVVTPEQTRDEQIKLATEQTQIEEKQRILGIVPNFYVNYDRQAAPLTTKLKFQLALKALNDPVTLAGFAFNAGIYQAADYPGYRGGMAGYGQRLGATFAGGYAHILVGDALLPSLLHQDPRYFYQGTGTTRSRVAHALSSVIFTRGDDGRREINYSDLGGDLISGALANAYYPQQDRGPGLVIRGSLIGTGGRAAYALAQEFVLSKRGLRKSQ